MKRILLFLLSITALAAQEPPAPGPSLYVQSVNETMCNSLRLLFSFAKTCKMYILVVVGPVSPGDAVRIEGSYTETASHATTFVRQLVEPQIMNGAPYALYQFPVATDFVTNAFAATILHPQEKVGQ